MSTKTQDGYRINKIVRNACRIEGVECYPGTRHKHLLKYRGKEVGICAVAKSTNVDRHVVPWLKRVTGLDKEDIYSGLQSGNWNEVCV